MLWKKLKKAARDFFVDAGPPKDTTLWDVFSRHQRLAREALPLQPHESAAATLLYPKTAALLFDRIWIAATIIDAQTPREILFSPSAYSALQYAFSSGSQDMSLRRRVETSIEQDSAAMESQFFKNIDDIQRTLGHPVVPIYQSARAFCATYRPGAKEMLVLAMNRLPLVNEGALDWEQVMEVRADVASRDSIRRFVRWADETLVGQPEAVLASEIEARLNKYTDALKKHGLKTRVEMVASILDITPKLQVAAAAAAARYAGVADFLTAGAAGGALIVGDIAIKLAKVLVAYDEGLSKLRSEHAEVAFLAGSRTG